MTDFPKWLFFEVTVIRSDRFLKWPIFRSDHFSKWSFFEVTNFSKWSFFELYYFRSDSLSIWSFSKWRFLSQLSLLEVPRFWNDSFRSVRLQKEHFSKWSISNWPILKPTDFELTNFRKCPFELIFTWITIFLENGAQVRGIHRRDAENDDVTIDDVTIMDCDANSEHLCPRYDKQNPVRGLQQIVKVLY